MRLAVCLLLAMGGVRAAHGAPAIQIDLVHTGSFTSALVQTGGLDPNGIDVGPLDHLRSGQAIGKVQRFDVAMSVAGLAADEDFWLVGISVEMGPGLSSAQNWAAASGTYDDDGLAGTPEIGHWDFGNGDFGTDPADLKVILVEASAGQSANRQYGEDPRPAGGGPDDLSFPTKLGEILVAWDGTTLPSTLSVVSAVSSPDSSPWGTYTANGQGMGQAAAQPFASFSGDSLEFDCIALLGDANNDGLVTGSDLIAVQANFGDIGPPHDGKLPGDANNDGLVSGSDLIAVQQNFAQALPRRTNTASSAPVPEPVAGLLPVLAVLTLRRCRRSAAEGGGA